MRKILFVCSGNKGISPIVKAQADTLEQVGINLCFAPIIGTGLYGYMKAIPKLREEIKRRDPHIVHAHYSLCGIASTIATSKPIVTSLMGSDVKQSGIMRAIIRFFIKHLWHKTIVKSQDMKNSLGLDEVDVIPNGVDLNIFRPMDKMDCRTRLGWDCEKKVVLFAADPERPEKNFILAKQAIEVCKLKDIELKVVYGQAQSEIPYCLNAADLLLLTSKWEGSPNIIKEAMACNVPVVSTDVGDVRWLFGDISGYLIAEQKSEDIADKIALIFNEIVPAAGRSRILALGLDSQKIAMQLREVYNEVCKMNKHKREL